MAVIGTWEAYAINIPVHIKETAKAKETNVVRVAKGFIDKFGLDLTIGERSDLHRCLAREMAKNTKLKLMAKTQGKELSRACTAFERATKSFGNKLVAQEEEMASMRDAARLALPTRQAKYTQTITDSLATLNGQKEKCLTLLYRTQANIAIFGDVVPKIDAIRATIFQPHIRKVEQFCDYIKRSLNSKNYQHTRFLLDQSKRIISDGESIYTQLERKLATKGITLTTALNSKENIAAITEELNKS